MDTFSDEQKMILVEFKQGDAGPFIKPGTHDIELFRWLVARKWNVANATEMFVASMKWRQKYNVDRYE
jgi:hypothetical protein